MKKIKVFCSLLMLIAFCNVRAYAQTQTAMNGQAQQQYADANKELNSVYQQVLKQYAAKTVFIKKFKAAERSWITFRDAQVAARYPNAGAYGSSESMCRLSVLTELTKDRIKQLRVWVDGIPEGDVCNGSVKVSR